MKRIFQLLLSLVFVLCLASCGQIEPEATTPDPPQSGPDVPLTFAEVDIQRHDSSQKDENGQMILEHYYDLVVVKGESEAIAAINAAFQADYQDFLSKNDEIEGYLSNDRPGSFFYTVEAKISHNDDGVLSVLYCEKWHMGGVATIGYRGMTFDLESGEQVDMKDLFTLSGKSVYDCASNILAYHCYKSIYAHSSYSNSDIRDLLTPESYCIQDGRLVLCFTAYTLEHDGIIIPTPLTLDGQAKTAAEQRAMLLENDWTAFWATTEEDGQTLTMILDLTFDANGICSFAFGYPESEYDFIGNGTYRLSDDHILTLELSAIDTYEASAPIDGTHQFELLSTEGGDLLIQHTNVCHLYGQEKGSTLLLMPHDDFFVYGT